MDTITRLPVQIALFRNRGLVARLIRWQTRSQYNHAALCRGNYILEARGLKGVVTRQPLAPAQKETIDIYDVFCSSEQEEAVWAFATAQLGKRYDYRMVSRFVSRLPGTHRQEENWFCSELVFAAYLAGGVKLLENVEAWAVSPGMLSHSPYLRFHRRLE